MDKNHFIDEYLKGKHPIEDDFWEMPTAGELERDEALYDALLAERKSSKRNKRPIALRWLAVGIAASVLMLLVFRFGQEPVEEQPALPLAQTQAEVTETIEQSVPQPTKQPLAEEKEEPQKPHKANRPNKPNEANKPNRPHKPQAAPQLAQAEPVPEAPTRNLSEETPSNPYLLVTAQLQDLRSRGERLDREVAMLMHH